MLDQFKKIFETGGRIIEYWSFKNDIGPKTGFKHTHVMLIVKVKPFRNKSMRQFIVEKVSPFIVKIVTEEHLLNVIKYHMEKKVGEESWSHFPLIDDMSGKVRKEGENGSEKKLGVKGDLLEKVKAQAYKCDTEQDLMESFQGSAVASDWGTIRSIWKSKPLDPKPDEPDISDWYEWKKERRRETMMPASDDCRKIIVFVDVYGKSGKTNLRKHFIRYIEGTVLLGPHSMYHLSTTLEDKKASGQECKHIIFDLEADIKISTGWYTSLESIKSGMFCSQKYRGKDIDIGTPHITIFTNSLPHLEKLIVDRWDVRFIGKDKTIERRVSGEDLEKLVSDKGGDREWLQKYWDQDSYYKNIPRLRFG
jgi:hypothetical protein